jgi:hypothetical protein
MKPARSSVSGSEREISLLGYQEKVCAVKDMRLSSTFGSELERRIDKIQFKIKMAAAIV